MLAKQARSRTLHWLGRQLFNRDDPASFFDPLLEPIKPMWVQGYTPARVEQIIQETPDTKTLVLQPSRRWPGFRAGQHVNICIDVGGIRRNRSFSLSSSPILWQEQGRATLTIKRLPGGRVTNWIHDDLQTGTVIGIGEAFGDFQIPEPAQPVLFIAGGSGITPVLSQLATMAATNYWAPVTLLYFVRTADDVIARETLQALAARYGALTLHIITTHETDAPRYLCDADLDAIPGIKARQVYLCGPKGLMDLARELLHQHGIADTDIHSTFFSVPQANLGNEALGGQVRLAGSGLDVGSEGDASLLDIAEAAGLSPRYGCRMGICHQCSCRKTAGTVINRLTGQASGPGEENIQLCISVPRGPVSIDI